jgi:PAS domain S-box-containing protein
MVTVRHRSRDRNRDQAFSSRWLPSVIIGIAWVAVSLFILGSQGFAAGVATVALIGAALGLTLMVQRLVQERRWSRPLRRLVAQLATIADNPTQPLEPIGAPELAELSRVFVELQRSWIEATRLGASAAYYREVIAGAGVSAQPQKPNTSMTRSGMLATLPAAVAGAASDPGLSGDYSMTDMVNRLEPGTLRWLESSTAEQRFLGWDQGALRAKSFLEIVHPDDHPRVKEQVGAALEKGEAHGLVVRIRTAQGAPKAIEVNIGARYGPDLAVTHLRCHLTDVSDKIRAERELRLRTRELTQVNEQLRQINRELEELKDRYHDLYQNASRTNEELSRKNREMDEFAYVVSHDLQEPLRTLIAFSDFLLKDCSDRLDPTGKEYVRYLVAASRRMRALIQGLLSLSRAGKVTGEFEPVNLEEIVDVVQADLGELVRSRGAEMRKTGPLPVVWGDRARLGQLFVNLVGNGLKYNQSAHPWVEVGTLTEDTGPWVTLYIRDNGIGIDPQFHGKIFQLFRRLHPQEEYEGTGAGLAICLKIVQAHGGRIWVESTPNEGATFFFSLKRSASDTPSPAKPVPNAS